ncbi:hypothetical protein PV773_24505, partial [Mesorhizobium sp. CC13]|uniref:hypothetical protein n=1 Tax=Mesorhizobium sp. CC13 TaxID=3029194 RepID=UPI0032638F5D
QPKPQLRHRDMAKSSRIWSSSDRHYPILTIVAGFTFGGWMTGGSARLMASVAARDARAELAAAECVQRFVASEQAAEQLAALKDLSSWQRSGFIKDGGWSKVGSEPVPGADNLCASNLAAMDGIPSLETTATMPTGSYAVAGAGAREAALTTRRGCVTSVSVFTAANSLLQICRL